MTYRNLIKTGFLFIGLLGVSVAQAEQVGKVQYTRGAVTMQNLDGSQARLIAKNEKIQRGEVIKTGPKSFTIVRLKDGTRMTIRPNSSFAVEQFNAKEDSTANALLRLFRGGLRTITGFISKKNPDGYKLRTNLATIGIRGTEFDARLCEDDCAEENNKLKRTYDKDLQKTVARVVFQRGSLIARTVDGDERKIKGGGSVYEGDTLYTAKNSYAIVVFRDKSRVSLQADTVFRIDEMRYDKNDADKSSALFSLLRGGLRAVTGLIGKLQPKRYGMRTAVATIGIRGTGYDLLCNGACDSTVSTKNNKVSPPPSVDAAKLPEGEGLYASVWNGSIDFGNKVLASGFSGYIQNKASQPKVLTTVPNFFQNNPVPPPNKFDVDESSLFSKAKAEEAPPGLYVSVTEGFVTVDNKSGQKMELEAGQSGYSDVLGRQAKPLSETPAFQKYDAYPTPDTANPETVNLNATSIGGDKSGMVCEIK